MNRAAGGNGRHVLVEGRSLLNFGSCSYLGLDAHPALREGAHRAIDDYGTQFSFSRAYLESPLYSELELTLAEITGAHALVAASTSLAHMSALPVLVQDVDTILIDQFAHASLHTALNLLPKVPVQIVRHNRMDQLEELLAGSAEQPGNVWYLADGLYSMLGDFAPFERLNELMARYPRLHLYVDDAHSTSCFGHNGRGMAIEQLTARERVVVALSLNKAFSAAGGALVLPNAEIKTRIRRCGGPMLFSGPIQPPMLGAAVASAKLHLSTAFPAIQGELKARIDSMQSAIVRQGLDVVGCHDSPIFQAQTDSPRVAFAAVTAMKERGYYCSACVFPAVPMNRPGIRFTVGLHNRMEDIAPFVAELASAVETATSQIVGRDTMVALEQVG